MLRNTRRHGLDKLTAALGGHTPAEYAALLHNSQRYRAAPTRATSKAATGIEAIKAKTARLRRLRLAEAEADWAPAPRATSIVLSPEACSSGNMGGSLYDPVPRAYVDRDTARQPRGDAASRLSVNSIRAAPGSRMVY